MATVAKNKDNFLTDEEFEALEYTKNLRLDILKAKTKGELPTDNGTVRVIKEVAESLDTAILTQGKLRLQADANSVQGQHVEATNQLMREIALAKEKTRSESDAVELDETHELSDDDIIDGELAISPEPLNLDDYVD